MTTVIQETDAVQTAQPCETDNLINVPVDYVSVKLNQSRNIKQLRGAARETQETLVRQTWKRIARNLNFSTPISSAVSVAMGSKRTYKETVSDKDEMLVEGCCKSIKRGRIVGDNHDGNILTAKTDEQRRQAQ